VIVLKWIAAFMRFLYKFLVGDDLTVAFVMVAALAVTGLLVRGHLEAWWLVPLLAVLMTAVSLRRRAVPRPRPN
jgi:hypothetical protein